VLALAMPCLAARTPCAPSRRAAGRCTLAAPHAFAPYWERLLRCVVTFPVLVGDSILMRFLRFIVIGLTSAAVGGGLCFPQAHEAQTGQDYTKYRQRNGMSCCGGHDCRPTRYELRPDGSVVMFPEGRAVSIPGDRVTQEPSDDGLGHWCGVLHGNGSATTFCAILPLHAANKDAPASSGFAPTAAQVNEDLRARSEALP